MRHCTEAIIFVLIESDFVDISGNPLKAFDIGCAIVMISY
jgi:hypothetical protein